MRKINKKHQTLQEALVDLYISIKPSKEEEGVIINIQSSLFIL